ncbi:hypothetical protein MCC10010_1444 [Bifidobacterium longum subsp. longum]|nr:hypothetical protein MCC10006_1489 [Bifidobacterium longum subsp. longum]TCD87440.1 hypothetical protein MCC10010_1444 [Bifidobacterium longum subsp. longum]
MLIPSDCLGYGVCHTSLSRRVNANSQLHLLFEQSYRKLIKKGEC